MPPKIRYHKDCIIRAAFELVRSEGEQALNFRSVAKKLGCSTQPVIYQFDTMEKLKNEVYNMADNYHTEYITKIDGEMKDILLSIGLRYIRFAVDEEMLFRFLFLRVLANNIRLSTFEAFICTCSLNLSRNKMQSRFSGTFKKLYL